jgi:hypothetical protein
MPTHTQFVDSFNALFAGLSTRQQEVIKSRFGLNPKQNPETLAAIGDRYSITRERVRQIEAAALKVLQEQIRTNAYFQKVLDSGKKFLKTNAGIARQQDLLSYEEGIGHTLSANHLALLLASTKAFYAHDEDDEFVSLYYLEPTHFAAAADFINTWKEELHAQKEIVLRGGYRATFVSFVKKLSINKAQAERYLSLAKCIGVNPYGDQGLVEWPEINPSTIRDRIYLILKKEGKPLHFQSIADNINKAGFSSRMALAPTVHNELIKDSRFVLVGRGIYALTENGFAPGTAREVINRILKTHGPLSPKEVVLAVQKERFIKPNTILVNLQNKLFFQKLNDGRYHIRQA